MTQELYDKLKAEQTQRIGFRDNLLYFTLGLFGVIIPTAISSNYYYTPLSSSGSASSSAGLT